MKMKSFILKYASKIMFYDANIACHQLPNSSHVSTARVLHFINPHVCDFFISKKIFENH